MVGDAHRRWIRTSALIGVLLSGCGGSSPPPRAPEATEQGEAHEHGHHAAHHASTPGAGHGAHDQHSAEHAGHEGHGDPTGRHDPAGHAGEPGYEMDFSAADRFAAHFDDPSRDAWQKPDEVLSLLELKPKMVVADLGAGTGYFVGRLSRAVGDGGQVLALDAEPNMVAHVKQRAGKAGLDNVVARTVPPDDPTLPEGGVDRVLIVNTWHHIGDRAAYAKKLGAGLRPGGFVLVVDFTADSDIGPPPTHRLAPEEVVRELEGGGLEATVVEESLPKQYVVKGVRR